MAWNSVITAEESADLERQQTSSLRRIFGFGMSARKMLYVAGLDSLKRRRDVASLAFARKCAITARFGGWFLKRTGVSYARRNKKYDTFYEPTA